MKAMIGAIALLAAAACVHEDITCTDELGVRVSPRDTTLVVGATFTPEVRYSTCSGRQVWEPLVSFTSTDSSIVRLDAAQRLEAVAPGTVRILVNDGSSPITYLDVTVVSAAGLVSVNGTIDWIALEGGFWAIRGDDGVTYDPLMGLPEAFRVDGLRVYLKAKRRDDMASVHMAGPIVQILEIRKL